MEEEKQKAEVKMGVDLDLNGNEILDITFDRGDYLQPFRESYQQLDFFSVEELIKNGYNTKTTDTERQLAMTFENDNYEEEQAMAIPYELRTIETEFQKTGYTAREHEGLDAEAETLLKQNEEEDVKKEEKELELEEIPTEEDGERNEVKEMEKEERSELKEISLEKEGEQSELHKLISDKRLHQLLLELIHR